MAFRCCYEPIKETFLEYAEDTQQKAEKRHEAASLTKKYLQNVFAK